MQDGCLVPALLHYITFSLVVVKEEKPISCGNDCLNNTNHFTWRQTLCNHYSVCAVVRSEEEGGAGLQTAHFILHWAEEQTSIHRFSRSNERAVFWRKPFQFLPATKFSHWVPMSLQFTDKCAKHHFNASVKSSWLCCSMPSHHIAPQATIYSHTLTMIHYSLLTNLVKPMMLKRRRTLTSCDSKGAFMSNKALPCSPHPATRTIAPKLQLDIYNCTRLCSYSFLRHGWCCGGLALC